MAHDADHLGYAGRRVLVSRKWSGKTLADHRADRKDWLLSSLLPKDPNPSRMAALRLASLSAACHRARSATGVQ